ncbi:MAG: molecular chaperone HtpG, partial [Gemmataceae bacterium]|nr:molecular chaperone HtpG [Gemmataceae bacterium]
MEFKTELKQLLHLITHSLYSNKEIFLRELISNAADAINKIRFDSLSHEEVLEGDTDWRIHIRPDKDAGTLTISDNGIGLSRETAVENLGTIARSGTRAFLDSLKQREQKGPSPELIGQFGVGFYSSFMVADRVTVVSRMAGDPKAGVRWESDGQGEFTVEPVEKAKRGTDVILHLKPEEKDFLDPWKLRGIIRKFSDFIEHPVSLDVEKEGEDGKKTTEAEVVNSRKAVWLRSKNEVKPEEYAEFYKQISGDWNEPLETVHYAAEGSHEFKALLFVPKEQPFDLMYREHKWGLRLYIQRVLIMDHCEALLPRYLRFVKGVVDSSDLPLNISRELLQENPLLDQLRSSVTRSTLKALEGLKETEYEKYVAFWKEFGGVLKEGPSADRSNKDRIADLFLIESLKTPRGQYTTLAKYVEAMPAEQKEILYLIGEAREPLENSPYLEQARAEGRDVLLLTDDVDEFLMAGLTTYKDRKFQAVDRAAPAGDVDADTKSKYASLLEKLKPLLPDAGDVRL